MANDSTVKALSGARLILGVSGSIAAYKSALLIRQFKKAGAEVRVVMTPSATEFITPLTLGTLAESKVLTEVFPENAAGSWTQHVELGLWADLFIVAPATANTVAKLAHGHCDSMLTATALSARCPVMVCPAMDHDMYEHPATQANLERLESFDYQVLGSEHGELASGLVGMGRLPEPEVIARKAARLLEKTGKNEKKPQPLQGQKVLVTAGPTREPLDPVRFLSNPSSGKMGFAVAQKAAQAGAAVTLVTGPTELSTPLKVRRVDVTTTEEMYRAVLEASDADIVVMTAAVSDFRPVQQAESKIKKDGATMTLELERTPDILAALGARKRAGQLLVGFALETDNGPAYAREKLRKKNLDWIVLNNPTEPGAGFGTDTNRVTLFGRSGEEIKFSILSKEQVADKIIDKVAEAVANAGS